LHFSGYYLLFLPIPNGVIMFFLGGINSILPYILYLSLIWIFLIIGFGSRIVHVLNDLTPKASYTDKQTLQHPDTKVIQYCQCTHYVVEPKSSTAAIPKNDRYFLPYIPENYFPGYGILHPFISCPVSSTGFRGPPIG